MQKLFFAVSLLAVLSGTYCFAASVIPLPGEPLYKSLVEGVTVDGRFMQLIERKWLFRKETSLLGDKHSALLFTEAATREGTMTLNCPYGMYNIAISFAKRIDADQLDVEVKFDDLPIEKQSVRVGHDKKTFAFHKSQEFIQKMLNKNRLAIRISPPGEADIERLFIISGLEIAIEPLAKECGWDLSNK